MCYSFVGKTICVCVGGGGGAVAGGGGGGGGGGSLVPRPSLLPRSDGLAREVKFLGFMGGATGTLIKCLYKGLKRYM